MSDQFNKRQFELDQKISILLITANVGSLFEDPNNIMAKWIEKFVEVILVSDPLFIAVNLQELGGKTYEKSTNEVHKFINHIIGNEHLKNFTSYQVYLDEDFKRKESFTALGCFYLIHNDISCNVKIWNFEISEWENVSKNQIYSKSLDSVATKEKSKFPQNFFPECKWSRKGFMRTRWDIVGSILDFVNIHLFHDASNLVATEDSPSVYAKYRRKALLYTLERFYADTKNGFAPFIIFGDFNFRCDTKKVIKHLSENLTAHRLERMENDIHFIYKSEDGKEILTVGKKEFKHIHHQKVFKENWLKNFDKELDPFRNFLFEFDIDFPPSYPFEENSNFPFDYMKTRCPSWCDRILFSKEAKELIYNGYEHNIKYNMIGEDICMGDHKPIYLQFSLKPNQGIYKICKCAIVKPSDNTSTSSGPMGIQEEQPPKSIVPPKEYVLYFRLIK